MHVERDHDRLLTGAYLALAGVAVGAGVAWVFLRSAPVVESPPLVIVPPVSAPVASASPLGTPVYPSSAFTPVPGDRPLTGATPTAKSAVVVAPPPGAEENSRAVHPLDRERMLASASEIIIVHQTSSAFLPVSPGETVPIGTVGKGINVALSYALEGINPYVAKGYALREDTWRGHLPVDGTKALTKQLLKGKDYCFCMGTNVKWSKISVHVYDEEGSLAEREVQENFSPREHGGFAVAVITPPRSGTYFIVVKVEASYEQRTAWGLVYAEK